MHIKACACLREKQSDGQLLSFCNITPLFLSCMLLCYFSTLCTGALISPQLPSLKGITEGFDAPPYTLPTPKSLGTEASTRVYHTDDLRTRGMRHVIEEDLPQQ